MAKAGDDRDRRARAMYELYEQGATLEEVGICFALTRERVRQIFRDAGLHTRSVGEASRLAKTYSEQELSDCLRFVEEAFAGVPGRSEYDAFARARRLADGRAWPTGRAYAHRYGSWRSALQAVGVRQTRKTRAKMYSNEEIIGCLQTANGTLGGVLSHAAYDQFARGQRFADGRPWPTWQVSANRFGAWSQALRQAGLSANPPSPVAGRRRFDEKSCIEAVRSVARALGKAPTVREYSELARRSDGSLPSLATVRNRCGSWAQVVEEIERRGG